jgi:tRNA 2-thiouridine synthesizing protein A
MTFDRRLDATGLVCPLPVLRARRALKDMAPGQVLAVDATDDAALRDMPAFCAQSGHRLLSAETAGGVHRFLVEKDGAASGG